MIFNGECVEFYRIMNIYTLLLYIIIPKFLGFKNVIIMSLHVTLIIPIKLFYKTCIVYLIPKRYTCMDTVSLFLTVALLCNFK